MGAGVNRQVRVVAIVIKPCAAGHLNPCIIFPPRGWGHGHERNKEKLAKPGSAASLNKYMTKPYTAGHLNPCIVFPRGVGVMGMSAMKRNSLIIFSQEMAKHKGHSKHCETPKSTVRISM